MLFEMDTRTGTLTFTIPTFTFTELGERAFSVAGPSASNSLPVSVRNISDISF